MKRKKSHKALRKDFFVEIRKTYNKFLSLLFIVALGVAFYSGVRSTEPDMKQSADKLYDDSNFMDIKLLAPAGLTQAELDAVGKLEQVEQVAGSYSAGSGRKGKVGNFFKIPLHPIWNYAIISKNRE